MICFFIFYLVKTDAISLSHSEGGSIHNDYSNHHHRINNAKTTTNNNNYNRPPSPTTQELDSRLNAIIALKEVVFTQRMKVKETTRDKKRLEKKMAHRDKVYRDIQRKNHELERQVAKLKEQLTAANSRLSVSQQLTYHDGDADDECSNSNSTFSSAMVKRESESIFEFLDRINERRKKEKCT